MRSAVIVLPLLLGCPRPPQASPPQKGVVTYAVAVVVASGSRTVTSLYDLEVERTGADVWTFTTTRSEGIWEEPGDVVTFDSELPRASDPWPLRMQHALSAVPTPVRVVGGRPTALTDDQRWTLAGLAALDAVDLPPEAIASGRGLLDPDGVVRDLQRNFPGLPPEGTWIREETIAGLPSSRVETCAATHDAGVTTWSCKGTVAGPSEGAAQLFDVTSETVLELDARGLVQLDARFAGTLVLFDPDQERVVDRPVAGHRLVRRQ